MRSKAPKPPRKLAWLEGALLRFQRSRLVVMGLLRLPQVAVLESVLGLRWRCC
jgi:hypothetical protein